MFREFESNETQSLLYQSKERKSLSNESPCASNVSFFTSIRSLGKINLFDINTPPTFGSTIPTEIKYQWTFEENKLPGQDITEKIPTGVFISSSDQFYLTSTRSNVSDVSHQNLFNYIQGYLYRADNNFESTTGLESSSTAKDISVARVITLRKDIFNSEIDHNSFRLQINNDAAALSGFLDGPSATTLNTTNATGFTSSLDLKNPFGGESGVSDKSFFFVQGVKSGNDYSALNNIDTASASITLETIIRPFISNSCIFFRRISASGTDTTSKNNFVKMELTKAPDGIRDAFRFYIRNEVTDGDFEESFSKKNTQASGLFIPDDVGVNLFDGKYHHLAVSWSVSGYNEDNRSTAGAGAVLGYIDGFKLNNREQVNPRLPGCDEASGPTIQANMLQQRIPIKTTVMNWPFTGNNIYIGVSNYNRDNGVYTGDRGVVAEIGDPNLAGAFDGQIQHLRMWNIRLSDGSTGYFDNTNKKVTADSDLGLSFRNFRSNSITGGTSASNLVAWWNFNELSSTSASDIANQGSSANVSNTGTMYGNAVVKLFDHKDITTALSANVLDLSSTAADIASISRNYLYLDQRPINNPIDNNIRQGRIIRNNVNDTIIRVGIIFYDLGIVVLDNDDVNANLNYLYPTSGTTGDWGFASTGNNNAAFNVERLAFKAVEQKGRLILNATASGQYFNYSTNPTAVNIETDESITDNPTTYITSVGMFNDDGELIAIAKFSDPVRKDDAATVIAQVHLDF